MKLAIVTHTPRPINLHGLWRVLEAKAEVTLFEASKADCKSLGRFLKRLPLAQFDKVLLDLPFKYLHKEARVICRLPDVTLYEEDGTQNFIPASRWFGRFTRFYKKIPHAKFIHTGYHVSQQFRQQGIDSTFVSKGYDPERLWCTGSERTIALGFIGTVKPGVYEGRKMAIEHMQQQAGLQIFRTSTPEEYREKLNAIDVFFSADMGLGEYMAKNFEAMACGCILLAYRQGNGEEEALGLVDGVNCLLYGDVGEAEAKLHFAREMSEQARNALRGQSLYHAAQCFAIGALGELVWQVVAGRPQSFAPVPWWKKILP